MGERQTFLNQKFELAAEIDIKKKVFRIFEIFITFMYAHFLNRFRLFDPVPPAKINIFFVKDEIPTKPNLLKTMAIIFFFIRPIFIQFYAKIKLALFS